MPATPRRERPRHLPETEETGTALMSNGSVVLRRGSLSALAGVVGLAATMLATADPAEAARRKRSGGGYNPPYAAMVVDVKTGRTLHAVNEDALRHPASVTKVMTLYLLFEQLERGRLSLDSELKVSAHAAAQAPSKLGLRAGSTIQVEDAILALVTKSANDAAAVVGENLAGSVEAFAGQMTRKARALGMSRTVFKNASGLPDPEQVTTARDLTILARAIQDRFPKYYSYFQTRSFNFAGASHRNHNRLLGRVEGVDGIKTGFTRASGFNLMTNAKTDTRHIVAVVLGGRSAASRDQIVAGLVEQNLPRAYAGARQTAPVTEGARAVASAEPPVRAVEVETTAATAPATRSPLDLNAMRPAVASAAGATSTTTPGSMRWSRGPAPANALAFASADEAMAVPMPPARTSAAAEAPKPVQVAARIEPSKAEPVKPAAAKAEVPKSPWVIQLGAVDDETAAKTILEKAKSEGGRSLARAAPFTEKISQNGGTLYRARFSGFQEADDAQEACRTLKRNGFACFAIRS